MNLVRQYFGLIMLLFLAACAPQDRPNTESSTKSNARTDPEVADAPQRSARIFLVGDSTMSQKEPARAPEVGWGMAMADLAEPELTVANHAMNGRSTKSFYDEGRWQVVLDQLQPGDYVLLQFGHNDQKSADPSRYAAPREGYTDNLRRYVEQARSKGALPILATSICRRDFRGGELQRTHGDYPAAMRDLASRLDVPLVDLQAATREALQALGDRESVQYFLHIEPGQYDHYPDGKIDDTHLSSEGALWVTRMFITELQRLDHPLANYFPAN